MDKVMTRMNLRLVGAACLTVGLAVVGLQADVIEQVLVKVNGEILTKTDVELLQVTALRANNPNITAAMTDAMAEEARRFASPGTDITAVTR